MISYGAVCFAGEIDEENEALSLQIYSLISSFLECGACGFVFSADSSFGLLCAKQVLLRKRRQKGDSPDFIRLIAFVPYEDHIDDKPENFRNTYFEVLENCDAAIVFARDKTVFVESDFVQEIVDISDVVICAAKSEYARLYATAKGKRIAEI